ncbi:recombination protein F [Rosistilla ulvae]|uniref:Recombination protein F n=1 Tax=Rosistilla ulvae TaxID=1930277 RepID=A0A517M0X5_9BACT|nr:recombination protein F [Rosistilla ulvae]
MLASRDGFGDNGRMNKIKRGVTPGPFIESVILDRSRIYDPEHYAFKLPAMRGFSSLDLHPQVTFLVGENGSGKSTMLEAMAIANGLNAEGGSRNMLFATRESHSELHKALRLRRYHALIPDAWFLRAESLFNVATEIENLGVGGNYGARSLHEQSHGEAFMSLIESRFGQGLYFLDEPEAALSPQRQLEFLVLLHQLVGLDSQFVIATHSPIIMSYPQAKIYAFGERGIEPIAYEETEHYRVTKSFLDAPQRMLRHLLDSDD